MDTETLLTIDRDHIWHPYSAMQSALPVYPVASAHGVRLTLADGRELIDGMSSWWCAIHGYNHPVMNQALQSQLQRMSHVMFGGLTHEAAAQLARRLVLLTPDALQAVFFCDSGSVAVEVAMKMAIQYWHARSQTQKRRFIALSNGYHGDTFGAMSVCDPITGMHTLFGEAIAKQLFVDRPACRFGETCGPQYLDSMHRTLKQHSRETAAVILEPIVQGAGGMWFYAADYLRQVKELCDQYGVLLIADEIATGFGRSGELFACEHAAITPDIMCLGKAMTGGYLSMAATLATAEVAATIDGGDPGLFMHGPTFMANPLACAAANASIDLLLCSNWRENIQRIETQLALGLAPCRDLDTVADVRTLGAIGVVEMKEAVETKSITEAFVDAGVWVRPFGKLVYLMPPYVIGDKDLKKLTAAVVAVVRDVAV